MQKAWKQEHEKDNTSEQVIWDINEMFLVRVGVADDLRVLGVLVSGFLHR